MFIDQQQLKQLEILANEIGVPVFKNIEEKNPVKIAKGSN